MKKKKWVMRWQASLMPDPLMIPDATVFQHTLHYNTSSAQASASEQLSQQSSSDSQMIGTNKRRKKPAETKKQTALVGEETFSSGETIAIELDPSIMSFLQEEEMN